MNEQINRVKRWKKIREKSSEIDPKNIVFVVLSSGLKKSYVIYDA